MIIDAHHHLWKYDPVEYGWIGDGMTVLRKDFLAPELHEVLRANEVDGAIAVQVRQTLAETDWLLDVAERDELMLGVVGWAPLHEAGVEGQLERLAARRKLVGVRHILQDEADEGYMLGDDFNRGVRLLKGFGLTYDILIYERHLPQTIEFVDRHPDQLFVLDHIAKPRIKDGAMLPWGERLRELASRENVFCKLSGMATEARPDDWNEASLRPYWDVVLEAFGPRRILFGSDWPVVMLAGTYASWLATVRGFVAELSGDEREQIWSGTAKRVYGV